jgi:hypothetical protein
VDSRRPMSSLTVPIPPDLGPACRARNTVRHTVPARPAGLPSVGSDGCLSLRWLPVGVGRRRRRPAMAARTADRPRLVRGEAYEGACTRSDHRALPQGELIGHEFGSRDLPEHKTPVRLARQGAIRAESAPLMRGGDNSQGSVQSPTTFAFRRGQNLVELEE